MDTLATIEALRRRVESTIRPLLPSVTSVALVDFPNYSNVGDSAIYLGELACLRSLGVRPSFVCDFRTYDRAALARRLGPSGTILLAGGGSLGDVWPIAHRRREEIIRSFPAHRIIQLPQTMHFEHRDSMHRAREVLNAHPHLTLLLRDDRSLTIARNEFRAPSLLCPDMAFALGPLSRPRAASRRLLWLLRTDRESAAAGSRRAADDRADWLDEPPTALHASTRLLIAAVRRRWLSPAARPFLERLYPPLARQRLRRGLELLASASVVITDRLHGHILCVMLGIPHVILDNSYGKLRSFHATWTGQLRSVRWAESPAEALDMAADLAGDPSSASVTS